MPTTKNSQQKGSRARGSVTGEVQKMHRIGEKEILHESLSVGVCVSEKMSAYGMSWKELGLEGRRQVVVNKDQQQQLENMQMQGEKSATVRICVCVCRFVCGPDRTLRAVGSVIGSLLLARRGDVHETGAGHRCRHQRGC